MPQPRRRGRPQAERAVDVHPGARLVRRLDRGAEVVERPRVDVARLQEDDRRAAARRQRLAERVDPDAALLVARHRRSGCPRPRYRPARSTVPCRSSPTMKRIGGTARHARRLDVPAGAAQHLVTGGGHARELRHGRARRESDLAARREAEQVDEPLARELLGGHGAGRDRCASGGVLVPRGHEPVRGERDGLRAADDPAEEARRADRDEARLRALGEPFDHLGRGLPVSGSDRPSRSLTSLGSEPRRDGAFADAGQPRSRVPVGDVEHLVVGGLGRGMPVSRLDHGTPGFRATGAPSRFCSGGGIRSTTRPIRSAQRRRRPARRRPPGTARRSASTQALPWLNAVCPSPCRVTRMPLSSCDATETAHWYGVEGSFVVPRTRIGAAPGAATGPAPAPTGTATTGTRGRCRRGRGRGGARHPSAPSPAPSSRPRCSAPDSRGT